MPAPKPTISELIDYAVELHQSYNVAGSKLPNDTYEPIRAKDTKAIAAAAKDLAEADEFNKQLGKLSKTRPENWAFPSNHETQADKFFNNVCDEHNIPENEKPLVKRALETATEMKDVTKEQLQKKSEELKGQVEENTAPPLALHDVEKTYDFIAPTNYSTNISKASPSLTA